MFIYQTEKRVKYYNQVIEIYQQTGYRGNRISQIVPVNRKTIRRWIANYSYGFSK